MPASGGSSPNNGRFLSADPNIDGVSDSQGYNRYSYVQNNPLNATDPSGFLKFKDILKIVVVVIIAVVAAVYLGPMVGGFLNSAFGVTAGSAAAGFTGAIGAGIAGGFASGFAGALLNGGSLGDAFKAGVVGAITGAVTAGFAHKIGLIFEETGNILHELERAAAHGLVGGAVEEATGGEFRHGFFSSAARGCPGPC